MSTFMISDDWRMTFAEESEGELSHYGKKGMKWGKRNAAGSTAAPSLARAIALGPGFGGLQKQSRFKDPKALAKRKQAGKLTTAAILANAGGITISRIGSASGNPSIKAGASIVGNLLSAAGGLTGVAAGATSISAVLDEKASRKNS